MDLRQEWDNAVVLNHDETGGHFHVEAIKFADHCEGSIISKNTLILVAMDLEKNMSCLRKTPGCSIM